MAVPIQSPPPPPSYSEQAIQRMEAEHKLARQERTTSWGVVWTLFTFKMCTVAMILWIGRYSAEAGTEKSWAYIISTTWYWFIIPIVALSGIVVWQIRLRKARKKAAALRRSEFMASIPGDIESLTDEEKDRLRRLQYLAEQDR